MPSGIAKEDTSDTFRDLIFADERTLTTNTEDDLKRSIDIFFLKLAPTLNLQLMQRDLKFCTNQLQEKQLQNQISLLMTQN
jgi:hypothetical protein